MQLPLLLLLFAAGCADGARDPESARAAYVIDTLIAADLDLIAERPELVASKYSKMATDPQTFLRGTTAVYYRDYTAIEGDRAVVHGSDAELVQLYGDPHLENIGATLDNDGILVDCTDYDATVRGPFDWEVRRAGLGLATAMGMGGMSDDAGAPVLDRLASAYLDTLSASGVPAQRPGSLGAIFEDLLAKATSKGDSRDELDGDTVVGSDGARRMLRDGSQLVDPEPPFDRLAPEVVNAYRATRKGGPGSDARFAVKDFVRKLGSGVASLANLRFYALIEGDTPAQGDDLILEFKEERDPPQPAGLLGRGPTFSSNAARVVAGSRLLAATSSVDPDLGHVVWQGVAFQVRREMAYRRNLKVTDLAAGIAAGTTTMAHLLDLARVEGTLLGTAHARGGDPARVRAAIGDASAFRADTVAAAPRDHARLVADFTLFQKALAERGPLLGARQ